MSDIGKEVTKDMQSTIDALKKQLDSVRTGKPRSNALDRVKIDAYGNEHTPLSSAALVSIQENRHLVVTPHDTTLLKAIQRGIEAADLGLGNPVNDGKVVRITIQPLSQDVRAKLADQCKKIGDDSKQSLRNVRQKFMDVVKKQKADKTMPEDEVKRTEVEIQKILDKFSKDVETLYKEKEKEIKNN
jgi:ribosome recycling factor